MPQLKQIQACFLEVQAQLEALQASGHQPTHSDIRNGLRQKLSDRSRVPLDEQLFGNSTQLFSKFLYHSVTSFYVGEKLMTRMPTWFFPAGAGPYSDDGRVVTHGFPNPEATFRFAEPVFIDTQQNFRVEIEIPEADSLSDIQRLYGPLFIWVVLDGYMTRDVQ